MNIKNYIKIIIKHFLFTLIYLFIISLLYYFELFSYKTIRIINYITIGIMFLYSGYKIASLEGKKGYLNGFLLSLIIIFIYLITSLIFFKINFNTLIYYISLITTSITGGILGVSKSNNTK